MIYIIAFLIIIGVSVAVHEFFHFLPAKLLGVKIYTFSIGMGKAIFKWKGKDDIDYQISMLPIGGYVKMLESRTLTEQERSNLSKEELSRALDNQVLWKKLIIVFGGPVSNLVLAFLLYAFIGMHGVSYIKPVAGEVINNSWASEQHLKSGDQFYSINGTRVNNWSDVAMQLINNLGQKNVESTILRDGNKVKVSINESNIKIKRGQDLFKHLGLVTVDKMIKPKVGGFSQNSPAKKAGFEKGDLILKVNGEKIKYWNGLSNEVSKYPNQKVNILLKRDNKKITKNVKLGSMKINGKEKGILGITSLGVKLNKKYIGVEKKDFVGSLKWGYTQSKNIITNSLLTIDKIVTGKVSANNLSGPIGIAKISGEALERGLISFLTIMAIINVSLGVLNLLPLPVLDGGHVVIYCIESLLAFFGLKLSYKIINFAQGVSVFLLISFMIYVIYNDIFFTFLNN